LRISFLSPRFVSGHDPRVSVQAAGKREGWSNYRSVPSDWRAHDPSPPAVGLCCRQVGGVRSCRIRRENDKTRGALRPSDAFPAPPTSGHPRPLARLPERPYERAESARKRSSAESVGCESTFREDVATCRLTAGGPGYHSGQRAADFLEATRPGLPPERVIPSLSSSDFQSLGSLMIRHTIDAAVRKSKISASC
jgi:hypothetical protein